MNAATQAQVPPAGVAADAATNTATTTGAAAAAAAADADWQRLAAEDLRALAWLHAAERPPAVLAALHDSGFVQTLSLLSAGHPAAVAMQAALDALQGRVQGLVANSADDLAADYAAIYLTHSLRAAPCESVWRDEDHLILQAPTFAVRDFYRRNGVQVSDWRRMSDDHLTHELNFVALLLERGALREAARFLQTHLLTWLPDFAARVAQRADTPFYAALAGLTQACAEACAARLPRVALLPRAVAADDKRAPCRARGGEPGGCD